MDLLMSILIGISCGAITSYTHGYLNRKMLERIIDFDVKRLEKKIHDLKDHIHESSAKHSIRIEKIERLFQDKDEYIAHLEERIEKLEEEKWEFINTKEQVKDHKKDKHGK